jgi:hypothetical protein
MSREELGHITTHAEPFGQHIHQPYSFGTWYTVSHYAAAYAWRHMHGGIVLAMYYQVDMPRAVSR